MKRIYLGFALVSLLTLCHHGCKDVDYDWENYRLAATPKVSINIDKSALPTYATANVSFFNMKDPDFADNQQFEWTLGYYDAQGRVGVQSIEVYVSFNKREGTVPTYPIVLSYGGDFPNRNQYPLPSTVKSTDQLFETVTEFPTTFSHTPRQLAALTGIDLADINVDDYFLFKFILTMDDGTRIVQFQDNACDESRGEPCDCRTGVRFKNQ